MQKYFSPEGAKGRLLATHPMITYLREQASHLMHGGRTSGPDRSIAGGPDRGKGLF